MAEFVYNNAKNASTSHIYFELNYRYYSFIFYKEDFNSHLKSKAAKKLSSKFQNLIAIY